MSIFNTIQTAVSGMAAQANKIGTIGDNIANSSTTGYKNAGTEFETLLGNEATSSYQSGGLQTHVRYSVVDQGDITSTTSVTDLAIKGNGFFLVKTSGGASVLTRAGAFVPNQDGNLINTAGDTLMGYNLLDGSYDAKSNTGTLKPVNIATQSLSATPSTSGKLSVNLPSTATAVTGPLPSANTAASTYTEKTSMVAYDNLGAPVTFDIYLTKTGANAWQASVFNAADASSNGSFPYSSSPASTDLTFDQTTGRLTSASAKSLTLAVPNGNNVTVDISNTTQFAGDYSISASTVNGNSPSKVSKVSVAADGTVSAIYASGAIASTFKIPLANVESPNNLTVLTGNNYQVSNSSGAMLVGTANAGSLGSIDSSSLESSTVDLATELTTMIATQRSYEANSKVLTTGADMLSTIIQSIRQ